MLPQDDLLSLFLSLAPEKTLEIGKMAQVLCQVSQTQPVGRRALAARLSMTEREIRAASDGLRQQGLIVSDASGMKITSRAKALLKASGEVSERLFSLSSLEDALARALGCRSVSVVRGSADSDPRVLTEVGRRAARELKKELREGDILAVSGGSTMAAVADGMTSGGARRVMVVPLRGGIGPVMEGQASVIAAEIAEKLGGEYRMIHLPDTLDADALKEIIKMDDVRETLELIHRADVVIHGIGRADIMAEKRHLSPAIVGMLREKGAVGEAFGVFFDRLGHPVYRLDTWNTVQPASEERILAAASGESKAEAVIACLRFQKHCALVTDESAARKMLSLLEADRPLP
ncbi:MAG: hypothetical protein IKI84_06565 [Clostridia bacterium]|nr:hypothetical protein [Clostridia bacterium]